MDTLQQVRAAVIGYGGIGSAHTATIARGAVEGMALTAVCDIDPQKRTLVSERFPGVRTVEDYHALLDGSIDAVIIAVPIPCTAALQRTACAPVCTSCRKSRWMCRSVPPGRRSVRQRNRAASSR